MKPLIVGMAIVLLFTAFILFQQDHNKYIRELERLKFIADECSASASLFFDTVEFSEGRKVFNRTESIKALEYILKANLKLDDELKPLPNNYWRDTVKYDVYFFDEGNTTFPFLFTDPKTNYVKTLVEPTVIVTINTGKPRYRLSFVTLTDTIRSSAYEYETR